MPVRRAPRRRNLQVPALRRLGHKIRPSGKRYTRKGRSGQSTKPAVGAEHL